MPLVGGAAGSVSSSLDGRNCKHSKWLLGTHPGFCQPQSIGGEHLGSNLILLIAIPTSSSYSTMKAVL